MLAELTDLHQLGGVEAGKRNLNNILGRVNQAHSFTHPILSVPNMPRISGPALLFDVKTIKDRMESMAKLARKFNVTPLLAVKCCNDPEFLGLAYKVLGGFDVSNIAEYSALPPRLDGKLVSIIAPALPDDLRDFTTKSNAVLVTLDSQVQLDQFFTQAPSIEYLLRVQGTDLLKNAKPADTAYYPQTRFGFTVSELDSLLKAPLLKERPPAGFHVHHGSEKNQVSTYKTIINNLSKLTKQFSQPVKYINLGGGWHLLNEAEISEVLQAARSHFPSPCSILVEPGRWYSGNAGLATGTIVNLSHAPGQVTNCTLNLSGKCHLEWSNPKFVAQVKLGYSNKRIVRFLGSSCYEADIIGQYLVPFSDDFATDTGIAPGKQVVFSNISPYSLSWNRSFNGVPLADVVWWQQAKEKRRR